MKNNLVLKIGMYVILIIFVLSMGVNSFARMIPSDNVNWNHLAGCGILFEESEDNYPYFYCGGETTVLGGKKAYALIELQQLVDDPDEIIWETVYSASDEGEAIALVEDEIEVETDTTYRLKVTHQARTLDDEVLEEYVHYSGMGVILSEDI